MYDTCPTNPHVKVFMLAMIAHKGTLRRSLKVPLADLACRHLKLEDQVGLRLYLRNRPGIPPAETHRSF